MLKTLFNSEIGKTLSGRFSHVLKPKYQEQEYIILVEEARQEWVWSNKLVQEAIDDDLIDRAIYYRGAAERRYMYLLKKAAQENIKADDEMIVYLALVARNGMKGRW